MKATASRRTPYMDKDYIDFVVQTSIMLFLILNPLGNIPPTLESCTSILVKIIIVS